jgi:PAS domain S-box-containing protein
MKGIKGSQLLLKLTLPNTRKKLTVNNLQIQVQSFNKEWGKKFGIITSVLFTIVVGGSYVPESIVIQFYMFGTILVIGIVLGWEIKWIIRKFKSIEAKKDKEVTELKADFEQVKKTMGGRITVLEQIVPYAVWEIDLTTGQIIHVNQNFYDITGWTKDEVNDIIIRTPQDLRSMTLSRLFVSEKDWVNVDEVLRARFAGEQKKSNHRFEFKHKDGTIYPAKIDAHVVNNNGYTVLHGTIEDYSHQQKMEDVNKNYETMLEAIVKEFTKKVTQRDLADFFFDYMDDMAKELKTAMVKEFGD